MCDFVLIGACTNSTEIISVLLVPLTHIIITYFLTNEKITLWQLLFAIFSQELVQKELITGTLLHFW